MKQNNLVGRVIGKLTVIAFSHKDKAGRRHWLCTCTCGKSKAISGYALTTTIRTPTQSCGCNKKGKRHNPHGMARGQGLKNNVWRTYINSAKARSLAHTLTKEDFYRIGESNCTYCGTGPRSMPSMGVYSGEYYWTGLDRLDSDKGYTLDNVVACCKDCNYMKQEDSNAKFAEQVKKIYEHWAKDQK